MMRRYNRLLVGFFLASDAILAMAAFVLAYVLRFEGPIARLIPPIKGVPPFEYYVDMLPFIALLVPAAFHVQGLYRLRRGRTRLDDFFAVFVGSILAVVLGVFGTLYFSIYYLPQELKDAGVYEISQLGWALFLCANVVFTYTSREIVREVLERRWRAGIGLKRVLIAGAGDLGRMVADKVLEHRELGFKLMGFIDDRATGDRIGYRGVPLLGTLADADEIIQRERIDHLYVALPLEEHVKMLGLVEITNREGVDLHVVPDLLQFIALRARLENLDGVPIISLNDVPLRGFNSLLKRVIDVAIAGTVLVCAGRAVCRHRAAHQAHVEGSGVLHPGAHGPRRQGVPGAEVPVDVRGRRGRDGTRLGARQRPAVYAGRPLAPPLRPRRAAAALERGPWRHVDRRTAAGAARTSSSSSSTGSRSTCCGTRSRPASPAGHRSTAGAATRHSRSASSTTSTTSRTGRSGWTSRSCG
jgi:hypothetical protein